MNKLLLLLLHFFSFGWFLLHYISLNCILITHEFHGICITGNSIDRSTACPVVLPSNTSKLCISDPLWGEWMPTNGRCYEVPLFTTWWRHQMETFSASLAIGVGNSPLPAQRPVTRSFDVCLDLRLDKRLNKQSWGWWFETPSHPLWRHSNDRSPYPASVSKKVMIFCGLQAMIRLCQQAPHN